MLSGERRKSSTGAKTWTFKDSPLYRERVINEDGTETVVSSSNRPAVWRAPSSTAKVPRERPTPKTRPTSESTPPSSSSGSSFWSFFGGGSGPSTKPTSSSSTPSTSTRSSTKLTKEDKSKEKEEQKPPTVSALSARVAANAAAASSASSPGKKTTTPSVLTKGKAATATTAAKVISPSNGIGTTKGKQNLPQVIPPPQTVPAKTPLSANKSMPTNPATVTSSSPKKPTPEATNSFWGSSATKKPVVERKGTDTASAPASTDSTTLPNAVPPTTTSATTKKTTTTTSTSLWGSSAKKSIMNPKIAETSSASADQSTLSAVPVTITTPPAAKKGAPASTSFWGSSTAKKADTNMKSTAATTPTAATETAATENAAPVDVVPPTTSASSTAKKGTTSSSPWGSTAKKEDSKAAPTPSSSLWGNSAKSIKKEEPEQSDQPPASDFSDNLAPATESGWDAAKSTKTSTAPSSSLWGSSTKSSPANSTSLWGASTKSSSPWGSASAKTTTTTASPWGVSSTATPENTATSSTSESTNPFLTKKDKKKDKTSRILPSTAISPAPVTTLTPEASAAVAEFQTDNPWGADDTKLTSDTFAEEKTEPPPSSTLREVIESWRDGMMELYADVSLGSGDHDAIYFGRMKTVLEESGTFSSDDDFFKYYSKVNGGEGDDLTVDEFLAIIVERKNVKDALGGSWPVDVVAYAKDKWGQSLSAAKMKKTENTIKKRIEALGINDSYTAADKATLTAQQKAHILGESDVWCYEVHLGHHPVRKDEKHEREPTTSVPAAVEDVAAETAVEVPVAEGEKKDEEEEFTTTTKAKKGGKKGGKAKKK